ncbi:MAG: alpha/beta hydrolase [Candidatus Hydrogenedentales bacterium]|jgi:pimeloyl-ACP methyl ester carboxylesterase
MRKRTKFFIGIGVFCLIITLIIGVFLYLLLHRSKGDYFNSDGQQLFYTVDGSGSPVILVHGIAANADINWRRPGVIRKLSKDFQVISFDLRGHGLSDKPKSPDEYGIKMVDDIIRLMDHLNLEKAHLAGYSLGGFISLKAVTRYPDRFLSVAICAAGWKDPDDPTPIPNPYRPSEPLSDNLILKSSVGISLLSPQKLFHNIRNHVGDWIIDPAAKSAIKTSYNEFVVLKSDVESNTVPLFCVVGTQDGFLNLSRDLLAVAKDAEGMEVDGASHFTLPFSKKFKEALHDFFLKKTPVL